MSYLLDTNIFAARFSDPPDPMIKKWMDENQTRLCTSAFTISEIAYGVKLLPPSARRTRLQSKLESVIEIMGDRILRFDTRVALAWGELQAGLAQQGHKIPLQDSYIAAIAIRHNLVIVTRNTADFNRSGLRTFNPFSSEV